MRAADWLRYRRGGEGFGSLSSASGSIFRKSASIQNEIGRTCELRASSKRIAGAGIGSPLEQVGSLPGRYWQPVE
ncbi:Uncharacterised protein [Mycobacteroides abscessus subsp. abscessus]|nr:Uncharacterised protein [Mycobacteroides abscessus subsp. abscessus]SHV36042.1 Uncharacterised protein [Mycobacteroides abscessus subsp. abscessus]SHV57783.1 Uncharacterised protein [Mycobacteroides abscessus subsp. abscessus]SHW25051.1 Uncharacterised protein [Mycobacteroides abscessus subsp. abscessus]SHW62372.1 Uncharacterised protein [Mycobacteroides abscessus subsp. abscessus]